MSSKIDNFITQFDTLLRTLVPSAATASRANPAYQHEEAELSPEEAKHAAGLMRINHTGEVCAQALYQGQALTAKLPEVRQQMQEAAIEEIDHLAWCEDRLKDLDSRTSLLNPLFYGLSFGVGALAGLAGDKYSLGFIAATEDQVGKHLEAHLEKLPNQDKRSKAVLEQMAIDEAEHAQLARDAGAVEFPAPIKGVMTLLSKVMTSTTYRI